ncbi:MAG: hypothetical protein HY898_13430 [Deltaproteobacteria bacterium]|nr:hypothetical protein [Deltaproteobacteria bacterium]
MGLLGLHGLDLGLALGFDASALDFALTQGFEARRFFALARLIQAALLLFLTETGLLVLAGAALGLFSGARFHFGAAFLLILLLLDAVLLEAEELLEGEQD